MKIKKLRYTGIKNRSQEIAFTGTCTAIVGNNRTGKTTVRDAILLGMTGQHPDLPKTNPGIMRLAGGPMMEVEVQMENGERVRRTWMRTPKGNITAKVDGELSGVADVCPFMPGEFLVMTPKARLNYLAGLGAAGEIQERMEALGIGCDDDVSPAVAMEVAETAVIEERKEAKREVDRLKKALQEHLAIAPAMTSEKRALSVADATARLVEAKTAQRAAEDQLKALEEKIGQMRFAADQAAALCPAIAPNPKRLAELMAKDAAVRVTMPTRRSLEDETEELRSFLSDNAAEIEATQSRIAEFDPDGEVQNTITEQTIAEKRAAVHGSLRQANLYREQATGIREMADDQEAKTKTFLAREKCPTCGTSGAAWKEQYASERRLEISTLRARAQDVEQKAIREEAEARRGQEELEEDQNLLALWQEHQKDLAMVKRFKEAEQKVQNAEAKLAELPARMSGAEYEELDVLTAAEAMDGKVKALGEVPTMEQINKEERRRNDVLDILRRSKLLVGEAEDLLEGAQTAERQIETAKQWSVVKADLERRKTEAGEILAEVEERISAIGAAKLEIMELIWKPIVEVSSSIARLTFGTEGITVKSSGSDFGLEDKDGFRPFDVLSGSEQTVLTFGLGVALAARRETKIAMIDELSRLDDATRERFLGGVVTGFGGAVDQVILMDHRQEFPAGVQIVKIEN